MTVRKWLPLAAGCLAVAGSSVAGPTGSSLPLVRVQLVPTQPPAPRREPAIDAGSPGPAYAQTGGYWDWRGGSWRWVNRRWMRRPAQGTRWIPPQYVRLDGSWKYVPGHWSSQRVVTPAREATRHAGYLERRARVVRRP
jgi:hypothetical protein